MAQGAGLRAQGAGRHTGIPSYLNTIIHIFVTV